MPIQQDEIVQIYHDYCVNLKPLIAEIESLKQAFPTGILNELRSCFDHLARCHSEADAVEIERQLDRARGHLKRAQLDCFKVLILYFDDEANYFRRVHQNKDWSTIDGGRFNSQFHDLRGKAQEAFAESKKIPDSVGNFEQTCLAYRKLVKFLHDPQNVLKVDEGKNRVTWVNSLFWCIVGAAISVAISYAFS